jgi:hypothetical protein
VQGAKEDAILEFHVDDGTIGPAEDSLCSVTFAIPDGNQDFAGAPPAHLRACTRTLPTAAVCTPSPSC